MKKLLTVLLIMLFMTTLSGCINVDALKVKLKIKNSDFEYIKEGKIRKITIQNTRDKGFSFVVTDQQAINELYDILSSAKVISQKTELEPDYIFQMEESSKKIYSFNYVAGLDEKNLGNLYSGNKMYIVSKRIDTDIINSFWTIRKPINFNKVYYASIIQTIKQFTKNGVKGKTIGINIGDDIEAIRFLLSTDLEDFKGELNKLPQNIELFDKNQTYDFVLNVSTQGYKQKIYKSIISIENLSDNSVKKYYVIAEYPPSVDSWDIKITPDVKPADF
ncbi:MAG TPA: hypothetical protein VIK72_10630 [Clostridiaceae bacterium]